MEPTELIGTILLLALALCVVVPLGLWIRNRRVAGPVTLALQSRIPKGLGIRLVIFVALFITITFESRPSLREGLVLAFLISVVVFGTGTIATIAPWRLTTRGILSSSRFVAWEHIESCRWWGEGRLTVYPKQGSYRFSSVTTIVPRPQKDAVDALLRGHTHIDVSGIPTDDPPIVSARLTTVSIVTAAVFVGFGIADLAWTGMAQARMADIMFGGAAGLALSAYPSGTRDRRMARWVGGVAIGAIALQQVWLFLS